MSEAFHAAFFIEMALAEVTIYEQFTFCLNTILSDIAEKHMALRDRIIKHQLQLLKELVDDIVEYSRNEEAQKNIAAEGLLLRL